MCFSWKLFLVLHFQLRRSNLLRKGCMTFDLSTWGKWRVTCLWVTTKWSFGYELIQSWLPSVCVIVTWGLERCGCIKRYLGNVMYFKLPRSNLIWIRQLQRELIMFPQNAIANCNWISFWDERQTQGNGAFIIFVDPFLELEHWGRWHAASPPWGQSVFCNLG